MSRDPILQATDIERMYETEERCQRWTNLFYAATEYMTDGSATAREKLAKAIDAIEVRR